MISIAYGFLKYCVYEKSMGYDFLMFPLFSGVKCA
jgi:hypothetical protein